MAIFVPVTVLLVCNNLDTVFSFIFIDQTPTPTRFLRNCDEEGLFEELGENVDNPFDRVCVHTIH